MAAVVHFRWRDHWRDLKRGRPGHRFRDRYERVRRSDRKAGVGQRVFFLVGGLVAFGIGVVLAVFPGPAIPFFFLAGALLASESRPVARAMDWVEVRARKVGAWLKKRWHRLPRAARLALIALGACSSAASAYLMWRMMRG